MKGGSKLWLINFLTLWIQGHKATFVAGIAMTIAISGCAEPIILTKALVERVGRTAQTLI